MKKIIGATVLAILLLCIQFTRATDANAVVKGWTPPEKEIASIEMNVDRNPNLTIDPSNEIQGSETQNELEVIGQDEYADLGSDQVFPFAAGLDSY